MRHVVTVFNYPETLQFRSLGVWPNRVNLIPSAPYSEPALPQAAGVEPSRAHRPRQPTVHKIHSTQ